MQAATRLRPDAAETHLARAQYLYYGLRDYAGALAELEIARRALPNDPRLFELTGYILRRRGQQEEGLQQSAARGGAGPAQLLYSATDRAQLPIPGALCRGDRCAGSRVSDRARQRRNAGQSWRILLYWKADTRPLHQTIDAILAQGPGAIASAADSWFFCALAERDPAAAERALVALGDNPCWAETAIILSRSFGEGLLARMTKDEARARTAFEAARAQQEKIVQAQPDYGPALCVLGLIDAALGRKDLALDEGRRAIALTPVEKDVNNGSRVLQYFAITAAWAGEKELALQQLEAGLRAPDASLMLSYGALKLLPFWDPLRGDPRFEKIVASLAPKERRYSGQMKTDNFFAELKRRNVYKVAVAYAVVGWLLVQVATQVFPFLEIPNWVVRLVIVLVAIGFPIALVIAWAFELTPEGIKRTEDVDLAVSARQPRKHAWIVVVVVGAALSVGLFFIGRYTARDSASVSELSAKSIAVLPFVNMSADKNDEYLSDGVSEELIAALSKIDGLQVESAYVVVRVQGQE